MRIKALHFFNNPGSIKLNLLFLIGIKGKISSRKTRVSVEIDKSLISTETPKKIKQALF